MTLPLSRWVGIATALGIVFTGWSATSAATSSVRATAARAQAYSAASATTIPLPRRNGITLTVATVNNPDMATVESLTSNFTK